MLSASTRAVAAGSQPLRRAGFRAASSQAPVPDTGLDFSDVQSAFQSKTTGELLRSWVVLRMSNIPMLVKNSRRLMDLSNRVVGERATAALLRATFFGHFCGGEDGESIQPTIRRLQDNGVGSILDYAAESDVDAVPAARDLGVPRQAVSARTYDYEGESQCDQNAEICMQAIQSAGEGGFAAVKCTALGQPALLQHMSDILHETRRSFRALAGGVTLDRGHRPESFYVDARVTREQLAAGLEKTGLSLDAARLDSLFATVDENGTGSVDYVEWINHLSPDDLMFASSELGSLQHERLSKEQRDRLRATASRLDALGETAAKQGVRLMVDAEQTYMQPAIDFLVLRAQRKYNREWPVVYNTIQCYLKDAHSRLALDLKRSQREDFFLGIKAVRGAYMLQEAARAESLGYKNPIHDSIEDTHACYDGVVADCLDHHQRTHIMVATHNEASIQRTVAHMAQLGLPNNATGVDFGQLLGMCDHVSFQLGRHGYNVHKYLPYGPVHEVVPYLIRRAEENSSAMGGVGKDLHMAQKELWRRITKRRASA